MSHVECIKHHWPRNLTWISCSCYLKSPLIIPLSRTTFFNVYAEILIFSAWQVRDKPLFRVTEGNLQNFFKLKKVKFLGEWQVINLLKLSELVSRTKIHSYHSHIFLTLQHTKINTPLKKFPLSQQIKTFFTTLQFSHVAM